MIHVTLAPDDAIKSGTFRAQERVPVTFNFDPRQVIGTATVWQAEDGRILAAVDLEASLAVRLTGGDVTPTTIGFVRPSTLAAAGLVQIEATPGEVPDGA